MDAARAALRLASRELLGSSYRLEVAVAIRQTGTRSVYARQLVDEVPGAKDNQVSECLKHFERGGLLKRNSTSGGRTPLTFDVVDSIYWEFCERLHAELRER